MTAWLAPRLQLLAGIAGLMLLVQLINSLSGDALNAWGVLPRHLGSLPGILFAPWLHAGWWHLLNNLPGLLLLGWLALLGPPRRFVAASATPCAWLPALMAMTPRADCSGVSWASLL